LALRDGILARCGGYGSIRSPKAKKLSYSERGKREVQKSIRASTPRFGIGCHRHRYSGCNFGADWSASFRVDQQVALGFLISMLAIDGRRPDERVLSGLSLNPRVAGACAVRRAKKHHRIWHADDGGSYFLVGKVVFWRGRSSDGGKDVGTSSGPHQRQHEGQRQPPRGRRRRRPSRAIGS
jgi:hypothetical protein